MLEHAQRERGAGSLPAHHDPAERPEATTVVSARPSRGPAGRLLGLDMLRGIAALCVVALHLQWINTDHPRIFAKGFLAVDLFFMLSGYVMARTYEGRMASGLSPLKFLAARYRRLWPIMAIGGAIGLPHLFLVPPDNASFAVAAGFNLLLLPIPAKDLAFPLNFPAWSIFFELTVNLIHGLVLWRLGVRWLAVLIAVLIPLTAWAAFHAGTLDVGAHTDDYYLALARAMLSYVIGIVLYRWWRDAPSLRISPLLAFAAMPVLFSSSWLFGVDDWRVDLGFIVVVCPLLIAGGLRFRSPAGSSLSSAAAAFGALSFPLYAVHLPVIQGMNMLGYGSIGGGIAALTAGAALTLAAELAGQRRKQRRRATA
jgi:peptidoglycan/LPS O-acetylase OafA/YrhL